MHGYYKDDMGIVHLKAGSGRTCQHDDFCSPGWLPPVGSAALRVLDQSECCWASGCHYGWESPS
jgi:hypothetical protein